MHDAELSQSLSTTDMKKTPSQWAEGFLFKSLTLTERPRSPSARKPAADALPCPRGKRAIAANRLARLGFNGFKQQPNGQSRLHRLVIRIVGIGTRICLLIVAITVAIGVRRFVGIVRESIEIVL